MPTEEQKQKLAKFFGGCRFVYNLGLETKIQAWVSARKNLTCIDLCGQLKKLKDDGAEWLRDCPAQSLQMSLRNLDSAYANFFRGNGFPKFKSKHQRQSIQFPQAVRVDIKNGIIILPKLKKVSCVFHRQFSGNIKTVTVSKTPTGKYFVSILVDNQDEFPKKKPVGEGVVVGIDMGVKTFATLSDGVVFDNPKYLKNSLKRLRVEQRKLCRKFKKGSTQQSIGYKRQRLVVARLHERIRNRRLDYLHKVSINIIRSYDTIFLEDLNIKGMMKNQKMSLAIGDVSWHKFRMMLEYKADWYGKNIRYIGRFDPSSKMCSSCGVVFSGLTLADRHWTCQSCNEFHERDVNAAKNIKNFGLGFKPATVNVSH